MSVNPKIVKFTKIPLSMKTTIIPLGLTLTEMHDILILFVVCHDMYICCMGSGLCYGGRTRSGGCATYSDISSFAADYS